MTNDNWTLIQDLFHQAGELQDAELDRFIQELDKYPQSVQQEVTRLLQQDQRQRHDTDIIQHISSIRQDLAGLEIEGYDIIGLIAHGGMGSVYRAFDRRLSRTVAIKVLHPFLSEQQKFKDRFMREARAAARIQHENINTVFEIVESDSGMIHIASAYCEGDNLSDKIHQGGLTIESILCYMKQLVSALIAAHAQGIIHRDLKPENIIINMENRLILVDFGIAKIRDEHQTSTGEIIGTPAYMSPEQFRGEAIDPLTDIWALGMILYEMMEGRTPYDGRSAPEIVYSMLHEPIPYSSDKRETYRPLYELMQYCLNVDKGLRPANAEVVQQQLLKAQQQLQSSDLYDQVPAHSIVDPDASRKSHPSIATHKNVFILHLFTGQESISPIEFETASSLVRKHRGQVLSVNDSRSVSGTFITASFGYPLADEMTLKNGLLCALAWIQQPTNGSSYKAMAHYQQVNDASNVIHQTRPEIEPINESMSIFIARQNKAGLWVSSAVLDVLPEALVKATQVSEAERKAGCYPVEKRMGDTQHAFSINLSPFTGRGSQLSLLNENWQQALEGDFQRVLISGEAGIGKSRLIYEFKQPIIDEPSAHYIELACSPYEQSSTYYPVLSYIRQQLAGCTETSLTSKLGKGIVSEYLHNLMVPEPLDTLLMCQLLGVALEAEETSALPGGDLLNRQYLSLLARILTARPPGFTTLLIIEDLHWIDQATSLIVEQLLQPSSAHATLIVLSCRPEYKPVWLSNVVTSNLYLSKLRQSQSEQLLKQLFKKQFSSAKSSLSPDEKTLVDIAARTGGNPLFIEELAKSFQRDTASLENVPNSIQDTLTARLEKLGSAKELAQIAAVIGRNFKLSLLQQCCSNDPSDFQQQFQSLVKAEIFYPSADPNNWYFKHALIRDAAYQTLLDESRHHLHSSIAQTIENIDADLAETQPSLLALHWEKSHHYDRAIEYWVKSALRNLQLSSIDECIQQCQHALQLVDRIDSDENKDRLSLSIYMTLGPAYMARHGYAHDTVYQSYSRALELCRKTVNNDQLIPTLFGLWTFYCVRAQHEEARKISQQMVQISEARQLAEYLCESHMLQGINDYYRGEFISAREHFSRGKEFYTRKDAQAHILKYGQDPFVVINNYQAWNELLLGNIEQAGKHCLQAIQYARELKHPFSLVYALSFATWFHVNVNKLDDAQQLISEAIEICRQQKIQVFLGLSLALQALLYFAKNDTEMGQKTMHEANEVYLATGAALFIPSFLAAQAEVLLKSGQIEEAEALIDQSLSIIEETHENWCLSLSLAIKTMILDLKNEAELAASYSHETRVILDQQKAMGIQTMLHQKGMQFPDT